MPYPESSSTAASSAQTSTTVPTTKNTATDGPPPGWFQHERIIQSRLTQEDFRRVADARRSIWNGGMLGAVAGLTGAYIGQAVYRNVMQPKWWKSKHTTMIILLGGATCSTLGAVFRGGTVAEYISDIWIRYRKPRDYGAKLQQDQADYHRQQIEERDKLLSHLSGHGTNSQVSNHGSIVSSSSSSDPSTSVRYDQDPFATNANKSSNYRR